MLTTSANGARLAYVVVDLHQSVGTVKRPVTTWTKKDGLKTKMVEEPAGYLVYFPRGHVIRCKDKETLRQYGLDGMPPIINLQGLNDPNSPIGRMLMSQNEDARRGAMESMEKQVIRLATAKTGPVLMPEQIEPEQVSAV
jgi:hypothetical protein